MAALIITLYKSPELRETIARYNAADAHRFSVDTAIANMADIYKQFMRKLIMAESGFAHVEHDGKREISPDTSYRIRVSNLAAINAAEKTYRRGGAEGSL